MKIDGTWKTNLLTAAGVIEMILFSGVIYGWANLVLVVKNEGYFEDLCDDDNSTTTSADKEPGCPTQDDRLNLVFTIAVFSFNWAGFFGGVIFDRLGTRVTREAACVFFFAAGLFSFFLEKEKANLLYPVIACLACGGMLVAISLFQIAQLHPNHRLAVSSSLSGALDSSSVVFLIFKTLYDAGANFRWILVTYAIVAIIYVQINTFIFLPKKKIETELEEGKMTTAAHNTESTALNPSFEMHDRHDGDESRTSREPFGEQSESDGPEQSPTFSNGWRYMLTSNYMWMFYYYAFVQLRLWFFVGSLNTFLVYRTDNDKDKVDQYTSSFGITQFFGFVFAPITGIVMDLKPKGISNSFFGPIVSFIITNLLCLLLGVLVLIPVLEVQYLSFVVQVAMRAFLYASLISFILRAFPPIHYGKLYGASTLGGAIVSLFQYPAFIILEGTFDGDPYWVNLGFLTLSLTGFGLPLYLWMSYRKKGEETTSF